MKPQFKKILSFLFLFTIAFLPAIAQDGFGDPLSDVPVDGGLTLLIAAGVGYGAKKMRDNKKKMIK